MSNGFTRWKGKQKVSAAHLNEVWDDEIDRAALPGNLIHSINAVYRREMLIGIAMGKVVDTGPQGEADYADERHWVQDIFILNDGTVIESSQITTDIIPPVAAVDGGANIPTIHTITNLSDLQDHTHSLKVGQFILYFIFTDSQPQDTHGNPIKTANLRYVTPGGGVERKGEFIGMSHQMVTQNEDGFDFDALHSEIV